MRRILTPELEARILTLSADPENTSAMIAERCGVSRSVVYKATKKARSNAKPQ